MLTTVTQWGNSLAVRIPQPFVYQIGIKKNSKVKLILKDNSIILCKPKPKQNLKSLLKKVTPESIHKETETGKITGKEIW